MADWGGREDLVGHGKKWGEDGEDLVPGKALHLVGPGKKHDLELLGHIQAGKQARMHDL